MFALCSDSATFALVVHLDGCSETIELDIEAAVELFDLARSFERSSCGLNESLIVTKKTLQLNLRGSKRFGQPPHLMDPAETAETKNSHIVVAHKIIKPTFLNVSSTSPSQEQSESAKQ